MIIRLAWWHNDRHSKCTLFVGMPNQTLANVGTLTMDHAEARCFRQTMRQGIQGDGFSGILESGWLEQEG